MYTVRLPSSRSSSSPMVPSSSRSSSIHVYSQTSFIEIQQQPNGSIFIKIFFHSCIQSDFLHRDPAAAQWFHLHQDLLPFMYTVRLPSSRSSSSPMVPSS